MYQVHKEQSEIYYIKSCSKIVYDKVENVLKVDANLSYEHIRLVIL